MLSMNWMHAKDADVYGTYLPCEGGRGSTNLERDTKTIVGLSLYIQYQEKPKSIYITEANIQCLNGQLSAIAQIEKLKKRFRQDHRKMLRNTWSEEPIHRKSPKYSKSKYIDTDYSFYNAWMKHMGVKGETEDLIVEAQDQALKTRYTS